MQKMFQLLGIYLVIGGISGTVDHLANQPILSLVLNAFNRYVIPHVSFLDGYEVISNLSLSVLGAIIVVAAGRIPASN
ncbi:hypothetical protein F9278_28275 [Streptomyces phaeolivaceus]|uniref:Uncharacterized protein n=1 Tax=Streptomyces phaeolivaceus TaxID=2653200 RepID=A0A5P8K9W1_9ACTN|nr:hypothetical protein [Streptomyces phaeolivaceus]QFQ99407.1 hypothetical protein F9278_28275 [Streptomyces phaeolivaceus]